MWKRASDNILEIFFKVLDGKEDHRGCGPHKATTQLLEAGVPSLALCLS